MKVRLYMAALHGLRQEPLAAKHAHRARPLADVVALHMARGHGVHEVPASAAEEGGVHLRASSMASAI